MSKPEGDRGVVVVFFLMKYRGVHKLVHPKIALSAVKTRREIMQSLQIFLFIFFSRSLEVWLSVCN